MPSIECHCCPAWAGHLCLAGHLPVDASTRRRSGVSRRSMTTMSSDTSRFLPAGLFPMAEHNLLLLRRRGRAATTGAGSTPPKGGRRALIVPRGSASPIVRTAPFLRRLACLTIETDSSLATLKGKSLHESEPAFEPPNFWVPRSFIGPEMPSMMRCPHFSPCL